MVMHFLTINAIHHPIDLNCTAVQTVHHWTMLEALHFQTVKFRPTVFGMVRFIDIVEQKAILAVLGCFIPLITGILSILEVLIVVYTLATFLISKETIFTFTLDSMIRVLEVSADSDEVFLIIKVAAIFSCTFPLKHSV